MKKLMKFETGRLLWVSFVFMLCSAMYAQTQVSGNVSDGASPLPGVNVVVKGTTQGVVTDFDGNYSISIPQGATTLVFSYLGFATQEVAISGDTMNVTLQESSSELDEVVIVGYGAQRKATITGAVSAIKGESITKSPAVEITNSLTGRLPGLIVRQTNGEPGQDGATINIRGINTLGNSSPLIVVDGIPDRDGGLGRLNPQDIESISVLKDASAAIYGARAANGVILITTKRGTSGKPTIEYSYNAGFAQPTVTPEMSNSFEYANIMNELPIYRTVPVNEWGNAWSSIQSTGAYDSPTQGVSSLSANYSPEAVSGYLNGNDPWLYPDSDWFGETFKTWAPQQRHNLQMTGGSEKVNYFASLGFIDQDAIYKNSATFYKQYNFRINLDAEVSDYIKTNLGIMTRREDRNYPTVGAGAIFRMLMRGRPTEPAVWPNGLPGPDIENGQQPVVVTTGATGYQRNPKDFIQINGGVSITNPWIEGLELNLSAAVDVNHERNKTWETPWQLYYWDRSTYDSSGTPVLEAATRSPFSDPRLTERSGYVINTNVTAQLKYDFNIGEDHNFSALAGVTKEKFAGSGFFAYRRNYIASAIDQLFAGGTEDQNTGGSAYERTRLGYYGRFQYNFKEKYLAEFIFRNDGSYIFPEAGRFGFFPGVLLGWNISNEDWFNSNTFDYLKFRGSYGEMGNDQVFYNGALQEYAFLSTFGFGEYPIDNAVATTLRETVLANPNFTWEVARNINVGLDARLFNRLNLTLEYFRNKRDQILIQQTGSTPQSSGISSLLPPTNLGELHNSGYEFSLSYDGGDVNYANPGALRYTIGVNGGYAKNEVIFMDEPAGAPDYQLQEGKPLNAHLVYLTDGVFYDQADINANTLDYSGVTGQLLPGDLKIRDYDGNGVIDADDQVRLDQNNIPKFQYGLTFDMTYKNFDLSLLFQGSTGASLRFYTESGDIGNFLKYSYDNRWSIDNPSRTHPRLASRGDTYYTGGNFGNNDYFLFSKDYLRLKNLEIGYNLPEDVLRKTFMSKMRIYVNGLNLLTFADQDIFDPETQNGAGTFYPQSRVINIGLSTTF